MKRLAPLRLLAVALLFALVGCGNNSPTQPPATPPTTPPVTPPTTPPTTPTPPITPPTIPTPPTTPIDPPAADVPYGGTWAWVVAFEDETTLFGGLVITQAESEPVLFTDSGEGPYVECQGETCPEEPDGLGVMGTYTAEDGSTYLSAALIDEVLQGVRLIAVDADNQLGTEIEGQETFLGGGTYYGDDGSESEVAVGIVRVPESAATGATQKALKQLLSVRENALRDVRTPELKLQGH